VSRSTRWPKPMRSEQSMRRSVDLTPPPPYPSTAPELFGSRGLKSIVSRLRQQLADIPRDLHRPHGDRDLSRDWFHHSSVFFSKGPGSIFPVPGPRQSTWFRRCGSLFVFDTLLIEPDKNVYNYHVYNGFEHHFPLVAANFATSSISVSQSVFDSTRGWSAPSFSRQIVRASASGTRGGMMSED